MCGQPPNATSDAPAFGPGRWSTGEGCIDLVGQYPLACDALLDLIGAFHYGAPDRLSSCLIPAYDCLRDNVHKGVLLWPSQGLNNLTPRRHQAGVAPSSGFEGGRTTAAIDRHV